jgi:hypothetical protein
MSVLHVCSRFGTNVDLASDHGFVCYNPVLELVNLRDLGKMDVRAGLDICCTAMVETLILELANISKGPGGAHISNGPGGAHTSNGPGGAHLSNGPGGAHRRSIDWSIKPTTGASNLSLDLSIDWRIKSTTGAPNLSLDPSIDWSINICHGLLKPPWGLTVGVLRVLMSDDHYLD